MATTTIFRVSAGRMHRREQNNQCGQIQIWEMAILYDLVLYAMWACEYNSDNRGSFQDFK